MDKKPILILGLGNLLLKDEGIGVHVVQRIMNMSLPQNVEVLDGGTLGMKLVYYIENRIKIIVIDAVLIDDQPGTIYRFNGKDLLEGNACQLFSAHDIDFTHVLKNAEMFGNAPKEVVFIGIKPEDISPGIELTPVIEAQIPRIIELVIKEIEVSK